MSTFLFNELIRLNNYQIKKEDFDNEFMSHPDYPNLSAIKDTLDKFDIENIIAEFNNSHFNELPNTLIGTFYYNSLVTNITGIDTFGNYIKEKTLI